ncbi:MAG: 4-hydroxybenzoyl-CoA reductase subunit beta [Gammaproteobacteria bacterium]|nr:4-hydroxybenzoyl-CoA reductase subunit beta [Gammaproteobacteria bacterium]MDH4254256.1 4-hydroxybenzoyl-CoA reductase subunit beta [Gammaproteobacteria bacterium]MDH5311020.1 4-hydroxybenzoyl-CoA reductase subunit beta [Gammaproteobacteria bacterium]
MTRPIHDFRLLRPQSVDAVIEARSMHENSRIVAGGTDLIVNLRRGIGRPSVLISLDGVEEIGQTFVSPDGARIGSGVTIAAVLADRELAAKFPALAAAAMTIAGPSHRNLATVGGNLCLDTRCIYYNQSEWWRASNGYCLKHRGEVCHVAPQGDRCHAVFSGDLAPALLVHGAEVELAGSGGRRRMPLADLYREDGRAHLTLADDEILVGVHLKHESLRSGYAKVRTRKAMDFPLAGVAVALDGNVGALRALRVALTGTNSCPVLLQGTDELLGKPVDEALLKSIDKLVQRQAQPVRTTLASANYRRLAAAGLARRLTDSLATGNASVS